MPRRYIVNFLLSAKASDPGRPSSGSRSVGAVGRAVGVLFLFARASGTLGVTEISRELNVSKAVVHRILAALCERGLLVVDPESRRYALGPAVMELAAAYRDQLDVRSLALGEMKRLSARMDETATLSVRHGNRRVYVDQVTPPREVKMTVPLGGSFPLHAGASSRAFLAWLTDDELDRYLADNRLEALTEFTITSVDALRAELDQIRSQGYAVSLGERQLDAGSVAAPVFDHNREPVAVISVCGPIDRFRSKIATSAEAVLEVTRALSVRLGAPSER